MKAEPLLLTAGAPAGYQLNFGQLYMLAIRESACSDSPDGKHSFRTIESAEGLRHALELDPVKVLLSPHQPEACIHCGQIIIIT